MTPTNRTSSHRNHPSLADWSRHAAAAALLIAATACGEPPVTAEAPADRGAPAGAWVPAAAAESGGRSLPLETIHLPEGFSISLYAEDVPGARSLALSPGGTLFVGSRDQGRVYALVDADRDHHAERVHVIAEGLSSPNGVALRDGALYVAEIHRVLRLDAIEQRLTDPPEPAVVYDEFPTERHHGWKFIAFGPTACSTCRSARPATSATARTRSSLRSPA